MSILKRITVNYENAPCYDITMGEGFDELNAEIIKAIGDDSTKKACIISDSNVAKYYLEAVKAKLEEKFSKVIEFVFPAGEENKNLATIEKMYEVLIPNRFDRHDFLVALGGGVVGDMTGFAAATYLRGIDFIQIPTSLLAQVDSSIGGKTGVDFNQYKNMVGAFHMPKLVYMNMQVFDTLDDVQFSNGMAEEIKHGLIKDKVLYDFIKNEKTSLTEKNHEKLMEMLFMGCNIKRMVVEEDPKEKGIRAYLNFGHTIGHAIEKLSDFKLFHGQCVAIGTVAAVFLSMKKGYLTSEEFEDIKAVLKSFDLPVSVKDYDKNAVLDATKSDKKMSGGKIKFTLLKAVGEAYQELTLTDEEILEAIETVIE